MSKQCPHCGSYNTDPVVINYIGRGIIHAGRGILAYGAGAVASIFSHSAGHAAAHTVFENTKPGPFYGHKCNSCGRKF